jgi:hypothetical protein
MSIPKLGGKALLSALAVAAVLAPVRLTPSDAIAASVAECTTCCSQAGSLCVVCSASCYAKENAYDNGGGPCVKQS